MAYSDRKRAQLYADLQKAGAIQPGEQLLAATTGMIKVRRVGGETGRRGTVAATDRRVVLFSKRLGGHEVQDISYHLLTSIDHSAGVAFGSLDFAASGDRFHISSLPREEAAWFAQIVREQMRRWSTPAAAPLPPPPSARPLPLPPPVPGAIATPDVTDQIRRLAQLRDEGILSDDEFQAKKKQLLGL